ncbi:MAG: oxidoreductase [Gammaproteobacteria bacterium]|nr:MAG: oxidoreductase [Gammaproteobacteria bacterium]
MHKQSNNPVAIVTGASTGIGAACAQALAGKGYRVAVNFNRSLQQAQQVVTRCQQAGTASILIQGNIAKDEDCRRIVATTIEEWGRIDILVNNAGVTCYADQGDLEALNKDDFEYIMGVNLIGTYQMTRAAAAQLEASGEGAIVNVSSHSGTSGIGSSMAYAASKGALNTMTLSLARNLAPTIRVNAVCPGFVDTDWMSEKLEAQELSAFKAKVAAISPLQRIVTPADVAEAVCWFGIDAQSITGQLLVIDGGTHLTTGNPL